MRRTALSPALILAATIALAAGCGSEKSPNSNPTGMAPDEVLHQALVDREATHYTAAVQSTDPTALRTETVRYASDMDSLLDGMEAACERMGGGGMMGMMGGDMEAMHRTMEDMRGALHAHHEHMGSLVSLDDMRAECEQHHQAMMGMMDTMGGMGDHMPGGDLPPDDPHSGHHR